jgi:hypothetical protein
MKGRSEQNGQAQPTMVTRHNVALVPLEVATSSKLAILDTVGQAELPHPIAVVPHCNNVEHRVKVAGILGRSGTTPLKNNLPREASGT